MRKMGICLIALLALALAVPVATQEMEGNISRIYFVKVKPGMDSQFEAGLKKHFAWHAQEKDTWAWSTWETISGEGTGMYGAGTFAHRWEDFDKPAVSMDADEADAITNIFPYVAHATVQYYAYLSKVSHPPASQEPSAMYEVLAFQVRPGKSRDFHYAIGKYHEAIQKTKWPVHYEWHELVNGGEGPLFVLVIPRSNWAAFKPMEKSFYQMLEEAYGRQEAEKLLDTFSGTLKSQSSEIIRSRLDLGYTPAAK